MKRRKGSSEVVLSVPQPSKEVIVADTSLGKIPDRLIAEKYGVSIYRIFRIRKKLKIKASHIHRGDHKRKIALTTLENEVIPMLGKIKDVTVAKEIGVSRERIRQLRKKLNIPKFKLVLKMEVKSKEKSVRMFRNCIRFNCSNYHKLTITQPPHCYNCAMRSGYPQNLGGDKNCENFSSVMDKKTLINEKPCCKVNLLEEEVIKQKGE